MFLLCSGVSREGRKGCDLVFLHQSKTMGKNATLAKPGQKAAEKRKTAVIRRSSRCSSRWAGVCVEAGRAEGRCWERGDLEEGQGRGRSGSRPARPEARAVALNSSSCQPGPWSPAPLPRPCGLCLAVRVGAAWLPPPRSFWGDFLQRG